MEPAQRKSTNGSAKRLLVAARGCENFLIIDGLYASKNSPFCFPPSTILSPAWDRFRQWKVATVGRLWTRLSSCKGRKYAAVDDAHLRWQGTSWFYELPNYTKLLVILVGLIKFGLCASRLKTRFYKQITYCKCPESSSSVPPLLTQKAQDIVKAEWRKH